MIYWLKFRDGFPMDLQDIGHRVFNFTPGINVLYGRNGVGKSVILKTIKAYCGIEKGGWSKVSDPTVLGTSYLSTKHSNINPTVSYGGLEDFPHAYKAYSPAKCRADVAWNGVPTFFNDGDIKVNDTFFYQNIGQSEDGITTEVEQFDALIKKPSSGQHRSQKINKVFSLLGSGVNYNESDAIPAKFPNKVAAAREVQYWRFLREKSGDSRATVLFDEPERSLSLPKQKELLIKLIPDNLSEYQVIMATHSPFALKIPNANIIDIEPGYYEECISILKDSFST